MRVLVLHNRYRRAGGEDAVVASERALLSRNGHEVLEYQRDSNEIDARHPWRWPGLASGTVWSQRSYREVRAAIRRHRPDVAHFHNIVPLISPSAYHACRAEGIGVVQTLHNFRFVCPAGVLFRDGRPCEKCLGRTLPWRSVQYGCYRGSRAQTVPVAAMSGLHRLSGTWRNLVDVFVALTEFGRSKFVEGGLPADRIHVKPNFLPEIPCRAEQEGSYAAFVGRLSPEKGVATLLRAWETLRDIPLRIAGDGPMRGAVVEAARTMPQVKWLGELPREEALAVIGGARFLIVPSECYEGFPMVVVEALASGKPVLGPAHGAVAEIVADGRTGLLFAPGDAVDLASRVRRAWERPSDLMRMGENARQTFEEKYSAAANYPQLMAIYARAAGMAASRSRLKERMRPAGAHDA